MNTQNYEIRIDRMIKKIINNCIIFLYKNIIYIIILGIIGFTITYFFKPYTVLKVYESKIIVSPNYGSVDYLYNEIELINSKIAENDLPFLKNTGINHFVNRVEIIPINNIYQFVEENKTNLKLLSLFADDGNINNVVVDRNTSKNYKTHQITLYSGIKVLESNDIDKLINYLNNNTYYNQVNSIEKENRQIRLNENKNTIKQIDAVFIKLKRSNSGKKDLNYSNKLNDLYYDDSDRLNDLYYDDSDRLNDLLTTKQKLLDENEKIKIDDLLTSSIIKKISESSNILYESKYNYFILFSPISLIIIFVLIRILFIIKKNIRILNQ